LARKADLSKCQERRPFLASECNELPKAEKWRRQIIGEISKKVAQIQNAGLGEFRIRDLNDEINKLIREKGHWEVRIKELGGPDYGRIGPKMLDHEGKEVPGNRGYKYFGAAKDLPGVRELFEKERKCQPSVPAVGPTLGFGTNGILCILSQRQPMVRGWESSNRVQGFWPLPLAH
uniref:Pre-mRNA-splicing factor ISY1 homolog n=1 Tax=Xenopus tropicalis TaxID=8364 RepID=A0A803JIR3_XENTR